jgi:hypothetical protein
MVLVSLSLVSASAQNLVPNPNFALHDDCPTGQGELEKSKFWYNPTGATPDYYAACHDTMSGSSHTVGVPDNIGGTQSSSSDAYLGIGTLTDASPNGREYAGVNIPALLPGAKYRVLITLSLADNVFFATRPPDVLFYKNMDTFTATLSVLARVPQVVFSAAGHITDKVNWVTVIDSFIADSAYTRMMIGNFSNDAATTKTILPGGGASNACMFYIDSISVEKIGDPSFVVNTGRVTKVSLSPNPFSESTVINIDGLTSGTATLTIMNVEGRVVSTLQNVGLGRTIISRNGLAPGFYYYQLQTNEGIVWRDKMIIR